MNNPMNNPMTQQLVLFGGLIALMYFMIWRPHQKQKRTHEESLMSIKKGDEVVTSGGIIGDVIHIKIVGADGKPSFDDRLTVRSGESRLLIERGRVAHITPSGNAQAASSKASASSSAS
jgi:preprotein translocase subunit YajC